MSLSHSNQLYEKGIKYDSHLAYYLSFSLVLLMRLIILLDLLIHTSTKTIDDNYRNVCFVRNKHCEFPKNACYALSSFRKMNISDNNYQNSNY